MRNYKLSALASREYAHQKLDIDVLMDEVRGVAKSFVSNIGRVVSMCHFSVRLMTITSKLLTDQLGVGAGRKNWRYIGAVQPPPYNEKAYRDVLTTTIKEREAFTSEEVASLSKQAQDAAEPTLVFIDDLVMKSDGFLTDAVDAMFASMLVGTWTAFETLAGDLWVAAMNAQPAGLATLAGASKRIGKLAGDKHTSDSEQESDEESETGLDGIDVTRNAVVKLFAIQQLTKNSYNLSGMMGYMLKGRFKFSKLSGIREAYSRAFSEKEKKARTTLIDRALAEKSLNALSAIRNAIIHKAGIADSDYESAIKNAPDAPQIKPGQPLELDGEICHKLIKSTIATSVQLTTAVDAWLKQTK